MPERIDIAELIQVGMKATRLKGKAIANNIANMDTPGYRRKDVNFHEFMADAMQASKKGRLADVKAEFFEPMTTSVDSQGNDVDLNTEVGEMIKNGVRYKMYVRLLNKMYKQMEMAITSRT